MNWLTLVVQILPFVLRLMGIAEEALGSGTGEKKKEMVTQGAKTIVEGLATISTGGQKETWNALAEPVSQFIDGTVNLLNTASKGKVWGITNIGD